MDNTLALLLARRGGSGGGGSGGGASVAEKDVNFYDYDGTVLYSYTVEEAQALTEMPALPEREGLICQGWNWSLEDIKAQNRAVIVGATYITDDGKTRVYISLAEGTTSPLLGVCPNGTVTVDWGDGTEPDVLTGTSVSTVKWTPNHDYASAGDYVISLTVDGEMGFYGSAGAKQKSGILRYSSSDDASNHAYRNTVKKIEIGSGVVTIGSSAFDSCYYLASVSIPNNVVNLSGNAFQYCYNLASVSVPSGVSSFGSYLFDSCVSLASVSVPTSVTYINDYTFRQCYNLSGVAIPNSSLGSASFGWCYRLKSVSVPNKAKEIKSNTFQYCYNLASVSVPSGVSSIGSNAFLNCYGLRYVDFSHHTSVPTLSNTSAFTGIPTDCEIRVPAALYDEWVAATNWSTYASQIVAV